jgi:hypothetical protein
MLGPEGVVELIRSYLATGMPAKIAELRARLAVTDTDLRAPATFVGSTYGRLEYAQFPAVEVQIQSVGRPTFLDQGGGQVTWRFPYTVRVYTEERGNGFDQVELRRKRLYLAVMELLTAHVPLSTSPPAWIDASSLTGSFYGLGTLTSATDNRSIAATYVEFTVIVEEMTETAPPLGVADTVIATVHPAVR